MARSEARRRQYEENEDPRHPRLKYPYMQFLVHCQHETEKVSDRLIEHWNKSLQDEADRIQQELKSPKYQVWQQQRSSHYIADELAKKGAEQVIPTKDSTDVEVTMQTATALEKNRYEGLQDNYYFMTGLSNLLSTTKQNMEIAPAEALAASLAIGAGFASSFTAVPDRGSSSQVEAQTFHAAWKDIIPENNQITQTGGWFSAMWSIGLVYQLSAQNIAHGDKDGDKQMPKEVKFAKDYVQSLLNSLKGTVFQASMLALLAPTLEHAAESGENPDAAEVAAKGKIVLLAMALALLVKLELKSGNPEAEIDEEAFAAMVKGNVDFTKEDAFGTAELKRQLVVQLNESFKELPEDETAQILERVFAYIGTKPDVEDLLDQQKVFAGVLNEDSFDRTLVDKRPLDV